ncbi:MAG: translocation/assembly module TamB domain-containing protein [Roseovarius sp.]
MRHLRALSLALLAALMPLPAPAQQGDDTEGTYLEGLIEGSLSGAGRDVRVIGFRGALSSNATLERLTIADDQGVWLTLEDASLVWSRTSLLRGRLVVNELTAASIVLERLPEPGPEPLEPSDAEATPFALPELPVSVELGELVAEEVRLGEAVLGEEALLRLTASLTLADGEAETDLAIQRLDRDDKITLDAAFSNTTRELRIALDFDESAGGLVGRAIGIPGTPPLRLQVTGDAPLADFVADVALSSDGQERFGGQVSVAALPAPEEAPQAVPGAETGYRFGADLSGDLRPLVTPDLHPFFGTEAALRVSGQSLPDGRVELESLDVTSGAMELAGTLALAADGWPERFDLDGRIGADQGGTLRLPGPTATTIGQLTLSAAYDEAEGERWQARARLDSLAREGLTLSSAELSGDGTITRGASDGFTADISFATQAVSHVNDALSQALGSNPAGQVAFAWQPGNPVAIERLQLTSGDASLVASGEVDGLADGFPVKGRAALRAEDLSRFAAIAGRPLAGRANTTVEGEGAVLGGSFDITLAAATTDLEVGEPRADALLKGRSQLELSALRDETGITLRALDVANEAITATASGQIGGTSGTLDLVAALSDLALVEPRLSGPARIDTGLGWQQGGEITLRALRLEAAEAVLEADGTLNPEDPDLPASGQLSLVAADLSRLAALAGRPLAGRIDLEASGSGRIAAQVIDGQIKADGTGLRTGIAELDRVLAGEFALDAALSYGDGPPHVERLRLVTPRLTATASSPAPGETISLNARLADLGLVAPGLSGPARLDGAVSIADDTGEELDVDMAFDGPGGTSAQITGRVSDLGQRLNLGIRGTAPLALANSFIAPRSVQGPLNFNLRVEGPPGLSALSGTASLNGARVALPTLGAALDSLSGTLTLSGGRLQTDLSGTAGKGGRFLLSGPITLSAPYSAGLELRLEALGLSDPTLYETSLGGLVTVEGPLTGGAQIGGIVVLGPTELRVPSGPGGTPGAIPGLRHVAEPGAVRLTRQRAGLIEDNPGGRRAAGPAFPLNLVIDAPNRIFVRGRGLDAELGGQLRLRGTTANVDASGTFELIRGRIDVLTKRLDLTEGRIDLRGALDPYLRFVAQTQTDDYTISVVLEGLASSPDVTFSSSPDLPQEEIVAQLLFGRDFASMSALQAAQLISAVATLSGRGSGGLTDRFRNSLGLADFDVTSTADGATQFSAGAYISENIYSEVVADSEGNNQINLNLDLSDSITVKGSAGNRGNTGLGVFFEKDY